ncbi:hypothetical protein VTK56DRAFT_4847 [Thermocarpiscus australiensis]
MGNSSSICFTERSTRRRRPVHAYEPERRRPYRPSDCPPSHNHSPRPHRPATPYRWDVYENVLERGGRKRSGGSVRYIHVNDQPPRHRSRQHRATQHPERCNSMAWPECDALQRKIMEQNARIARRPSLCVAPQQSKVQFVEGDAGLARPRSERRQGRG